MRQNNLRQVPHAQEEICLLDYIKLYFVVMADAGAESADDRVRMNSGVSLGWSFNRLIKLQDLKGLKVDHELALLLLDRYVVWEMNNNNNFSFHNKITIIEQNLLVVGLCVTSVYKQY